MNTRRQLELLDLHPEIENMTLEVCEGLKKQQKLLTSLREIIQFWLLNMTWHLFETLLRKLRLCI